MNQRNDDRQHVLDSIAKALGNESRDSFRKRPKKERPQFAADIDTLQESLENAGCTVQVINDIDVLPGKVATLMEKWKFGKTLAAGDKKLMALDWKSSGLEATLEWNEKLKVSVTGCLGAIAETGQYLVANDCQDAKLSLLADTHIVVIDENNIHASADELEKILGTTPPSLVTLVAGPSRTADIEQTLVMGAHGPRRVEAFIVSCED